MWALPAYTILFRKFQWEKWFYILNLQTWELKRMRALPAYTILFRKFQWEKCYFTLNL